MTQHHREEPPGAWAGAECNELLPAEALFRGYCLMRLTPLRAFGAGPDPDPYVLYDRWGHIVHQWPEDYSPPFVEVLEMWQRISERKGGQREL